MKKPSKFARYAWFSSGGHVLRIRGRERLLFFYGVGLVGVILIGVTGAITALGDTLFPSSSLAEGFRQDFSQTSHYLLSLRIWHPVVAVLVAIYSGYRSAGVAFQFRAIEQANCSGVRQLSDCSIGSRARECPVISASLDAACPFAAGRSGLDFFDFIIRLGVP
jgi:hypothetical protein